MLTEVGDTWPKRFAEGAATGTLHARSSAKATGWLGTRTPTLPVPAVKQSGKCAAMGAISVSPPGQKRVPSATNTARSCGSSNTTCSSAACGITPQVNRENTKEVNRGFNDSINNGVRYTI